MPGIYHEKLSLTRPNVTIEGAGASPSDTVISFGDYGYEIMPDGIKRGTFRSYTFSCMPRRHAAQLNHPRILPATPKRTGRQSHSTPNATVLSRNPAAFSDIRIRFLPVRFPRRNTSPAASAGRPSPHRASTADNIITTAISAAISTLFSAVRPLTLKAVRSHP